MMHRAQEHLVLLAREYPDIWSQIDELLASLRARGGTWPSFCWAPVSMPLAVMLGAGKQPLHHARDVNRIGALAAWRPTQGIYRLDDALIEELWASAVDGAVPTSPLLHLPEWCIYIETPGRTLDGRVFAQVKSEPAVLTLHGYFAYLSTSPHPSAPVQLQFLLDTTSGLSQISMPLGTERMTIAEAGRLYVAQGTGFVSEQVRSSFPLELYEETLRPLLSVLLYVCTSNEARPSHPQPKPGRKGGPPRHYPPQKPHVETLGVRLGSELKAARLRAVGGGGGSPSEIGTTPHVRRAHWHTFVLGPRDAPDEQRREVRWLPPIFVRIGMNEELAPVVRRVRA